MAKKLAVGTVGADPELFFVDKRSGILYPMCGTLGGTKSMPVRMPNSPLADFTMQEDNVMAEFNIPPSESPAHFCAFITKGLELLQSYVQTSISSFLVPDENCSRLFPNFLLTSPKSREFGCTPDFDAYRDGEPWTKIDHAKQLSEQDGEWRFAGGHIHLGYNVRIPPYVAANLADVFLGLTSLVGERPDIQGKRREFYGQPGRYRPTSYGIEYRTMSNFWLFSEVDRNKIAYRAFGLNASLNGPTAQLQAAYREIPWSDVRRAILEENGALASDLLSYLDGYSALQLNN